MKNWLNIPLLNLVLVKQGKKPQKLDDSVFEGGLPYLDVVAIEKNQIRQYASRNSHNTANKEDIFVLRTGGRNGLILRGKEGVIGSTLFCLTPIIINNSHLYYYLKFKEYEYSDTRDLRTSFWKMDIPIPPISEQTQIVSILDEVFKNLAQAEKQLATIPRLLARYRQSVLEQAVSGELTEDWREENDIAFDWRVIKLRQLTSKLQYGTSEKSNDNGKIPVLRMGNIQDGKIIWNNLKFSSNGEDISKFLLKKGDVLFNRTNSSELVGKTAIFNSDNPAIFAGYLVRITCKQELNPFFLNIVLNAPKSKQFFQYIKVGNANQANISASKLASLDINLPSDKEQTEIVRRVEKLLQKADEIEAKYQDAMKFMAKLQQSILTRAFSGEFSEPQADDEPVSVLLKRIKVEKAKMEGERKALQKQQSILKKNMAKQPKITKSITDILQEAPNQTLTVEEVWRESAFHSNKEIELFYEELVRLEYEEKKIKHEFKDTKKVRTNLILVKNAD